MQEVPRTLAGRPVGRGAPACSPTHALQEAVEALQAARAVTSHLIEDLSALQLRIQYDPLFSPIGWHVGHIAWQQECWLLRQMGGQAPKKPSLDGLWNSFDSVKASRGGRLPSKRETLAYLNQVFHEVLELLASRAPHGSDALACAEMARFVANHERQHAEIIGTVRWLGGLVMPRKVNHGQSMPSRQQKWVSIPGGLADIGALADPDAWDNELGQHTTELKPYAIAAHAVSAGQWLEFIQEGGYSDASLWSEAGWQYRCRHELQAPMFWCYGRDGWQRHTLHGLEPVASALPVANISWYEAQAFARFAGARLPSEAEWEHAAAWDAKAKKNRRWPWADVSVARECSALAARQSDFSPVDGHPEADSPVGARLMVGNVWEWVACPFQPYPGFRPQAYAGYSKPWFDGQHRVARGGSFLTQPEIARASFRNFYLPELRQPALGLRLAKDA